MRTVAGKAQETVDFVKVDDEFTLPAFASSTSLFIKTVNDSLGEGYETFTLRLETVNGAVPAADLTIFIEDSDPYISLSLDSAGTLSISSTFSTQIELQSSSDLQTREPIGP